MLLQADHSWILTAFRQSRSVEFSQGLHSKFSQDVDFSLTENATLKVLYYKVQNQVFMMSFLQLVFIMMMILGLAVIPLSRLKLKRRGVKHVDAH